MKPFKFHIYKNCESCKGTGKQGEAEIMPVFNVRTMEFDFKDSDNRCSECMERSMDDFCEYAEKEV